MPAPPDLSGLSHAEKDALILALLAQLASAHEKIAALEARLDELTRPAKTPDNSSKPPSAGQKPNHPAADRPPRKSRPGVGRTLHPNPDRVIEVRLSACPNELRGGVPGGGADPAPGLRAHRVAADPPGCDPNSAVRLQAPHQPIGVAIDAVPQATTPGG